MIEKNWKELIKPAKLMVKHNDDQKQNAIQQFAEDSPNVDKTCNRERRGARRYEGEHVIYDEKCQK